MAQTIVSLIFLIIALGLVIFAVCQLDRAGRQESRLRLWHDLYKSLGKESEAQRKDLASARDNIRALYSAPETYSITERSGSVQVHAVYAGKVAPVIKE